MNSDTTEIVQQALVLSRNAIADEKRAAVLVLSVLPWRRAEGFRVFSGAQTMSGVALCLGIVARITDQINQQTETRKPK